MNRGQCKNCLHWSKYSDGKIKCSFYGSMPRNTNADDLCVIENRASFGFTPKILKGGRDGE